MWQYNGTYGGAEMRGWLWVEGSWKWGAVLTWHLQKVDGFDWVYDWVCYCWEWNFRWDSEGWDCKFLLCVEEPQAMTMPYWMVHEDADEQ